MARRQGHTYARIEEDVAGLDVTVENRPDGIALAVAMALLERKEDVRENMPDEAFLDVRPVHMRHTL